ncbi:hypothetical protein [Tenacibaculum jejuense]|uniref:Uncharacterized protein n=1 Tax=Tenacibaculum jejuense TaxID=584609 RepID=A0A238U7I0_9FLAO|nr:hypothetical protein [Tenacibaculum jejuense]SNR15117.1 conserved protein of unknown function [Tenacibaculum jejuense]
MRKRKPNIKETSSLFPIVTFFCVAILFIFSNFYTPKWNFKWKGIRNEIKDSIIALDTYGTITGDAVGYAGRTPQQFYRQKWILKNATPSELYNLLDYPSGAVKAIAYEGLMYNPKVKKYPLFKRSLNDTLTFVFSQYGCEGSGAMLSDYVINFIANIDKGVPPRYNPPEIKLSEEEKDEILKLFYKRKAKENYYMKEFYKTLK